MLIMSSLLKRTKANINVEQLFKEAISTDFKGFSQRLSHKRRRSRVWSEIRHYLMLTDIDEPDDAPINGLT